MRHRGRPGTAPFGYRRWCARNWRSGHTVPAPPGEHKASSSVTAEAPQMLATSAANHRTGGIGRLDALRAENNAQAAEHGALAVGLGENAVAVEVEECPTFKVATTELRLRGFTEAATVS